MITPSSDNLEKAWKTPHPTTKKQVRSSLELVGYYRDHIPAFPEISGPLSDLFKKGKSEQVKWNEVQEYSSSLLKEYMLEELVMKLPALRKRLVHTPDQS